MQHSVIELVGVTKRYPGAESDAVADLTMSISAGELVVLVGPSGCGKTTILRMLNRLEEPASGQILLNGEPLKTQPVHELRRGIGYVIQNVGLFPHRTVAENIATVPSLLKWDRQRIAKRVEELVDIVELDPAILKRYPHQLSGGQQQRVGLARAVAADPPILLMDEPYSAVDPVVRKRLQEELVRLHERTGATIVLVTHDIDEAIAVGDRIAVLETGGVLAQFSPPAELLASPANPFVEEFLGRQRGLRMLSVIPANSLAVTGATGDAEVRLDSAASAADALDAMTRSGATSVLIDTHDGVPGLVTLDAVLAAGREQRSWQR